jgi:hypothetical protein
VEEERKDLNSCSLLEKESRKEREEEEEEEE